MKRIIRQFFIPIILIFSYFGCLDDRLFPELNLQTESAIELLVYLESHGDYINTPEINEFVSDSEVYAYRNSYLIVDVRSKNDYILGHIENAVNIDPKNLLEFLKNKDLTNYPKIVLISESGQSAAYYTALLRLAGFANVYSMEYGMAVWHLNFANIWLNATRDFRIGYNYFTNLDYPKPDLTNLPKVSFQSGNSSIKEKLDEQIQKLLTAGFNEKIVDSSDMPKYSTSFSNDNQSSIVVETLYSSYNGQSNSFTNYFVLCFGNNFLYKAHSLEGPFAGQGHLPSAVHYLPTVDLRSANYLQTLPTNKTVVVYDVNGQVSPKIAAYLRVLGYDSKSILFGANNLFYSRVMWVESLAQYAFKSERINNHPYITGE